MATRAFDCTSILLRSSALTYFMISLRADCIRRLARLRFPRYVPSGEAIPIIEKALSVALGSAAMARISLDRRSNSSIFCSSCVFNWLLPLAKRRRISPCVSRSLISGSGMYSLPSKSQPPSVYSRKRSGLTVPLAMVMVSRHNILV